MPAPHEINELIERFERNAEEYRSGQYNETQLRRDFLDPFFEALGWDVNNRKGYSERYRHVIHEDAIKIGGHTKAPDYGFYVGETRKFFVEAKKPSVNIKHDVAAAFQLRRYGWSAKLPLSILTNFDEFAVYDCRSLKPGNTDKASTARLLYLEYKDYAERWDEIASIFSREALLQGAFDKYAEQARGRRGTAEVDAAFLDEIESWRKSLASNIYLRNPQLTTRELNFAVGIIIDRIIFLRICEDRGIEPDELLKGLIAGKEIYAQLLGIFYRADQKYNSGLFHFEKEKGRAESPDTLTPGLTIDDRVLKDIFKNIYLPVSPYEFSVLPADILGQVYEQFLGKVIHLTAHRAVVEDKPEVRKAGGVYYTPSYIVDYIVKQTVGVLCEGKTPKQVDRLRILDPACGSGSFLISAYQYLLDWYLSRYVEEGAEKHLKRLTQDSRGEWRLTTAEKRRILLQNIYGVDIDAQAVEVTKLSLLLKVLEGESEQSLAKQMRLLHERALPDLGSNIKCGNSLIGPDFYDDPEMRKLDEEEHYRINAFDWDREFAEIMKVGGFDAVIGNPPWGADIDKELGYFHAKYPSSTQEHTDSFKLFIEQALKLSSQNGLTSMIVPNTLLRQNRIKDVRSLMLGYSIISLVDLGENVFKKVVAPSCIFVIQKAQPDSDHKASVLRIGQFSNTEKAVRLENNNAAALFSQKTFYNNADFDFVAPAKSHVGPIILLGQVMELACKDAGINYQRVSVGMQEKGKSDLSDRLLYEGRKQKAEDRMYWKGVDINRYWIAETTERFCRTNYREFIRDNEVVHLSVKVYQTIPKILIRQTADRIIATIDYQGVWFGRSIIAIIPTGSSQYRLEYFLALLNSKYLRVLYNELTHESGRVFAQVKLSKLKQLPIYQIDFSNVVDKARHDRMVELVEQMLSLHKQLAAARTDQEQKMLQRRIEATDAQIDALVYELYGLTEEEIKMVEEASR